MTELNLHGFASESQRQLFKYWTNIRRGRVMPHRADLEPRHIKRLLPFICMYDVLREQNNGRPNFKFRARLVGTNIVDTVGKDFTGKIFCGTSPEAPAGLSGAEKVFADVVDTDKPVYGESFMDWPHKKHFRYSFLAMPLNVDRQTEHTDIILLGLHFYSYAEEYTYVPDHLLPCQA
ncbi:PAS domain-containing protein [Emcibacter sp.]|uniref:PAS domain-containing protein n=1 Tax=Emcibacter sp. TaxID=1979954 RepID=UPI002AA7FEB4|nr:PAS domain-containing protein [Emcibacter sp.]